MENNRFNLEGILKEGVNIIDDSITLRESIIIEIKKKLSDYEMDPEQRLKFEDELENHINMVDKYIQLKKEYEIKLSELNYLYNKK